MSELRVNVEAIGRNTEAVVSLLRQRGLQLVAVTKGCRGEPQVAAAMLEAGAVGLADTRDQNLRRLRQALPHAELHRIYLPSLARPFEPGDVTYVSSREGAAAVAALAATAAAPRRVMLQLETGDEREGVPEDELSRLAEAVVSDPRLRLEGIATNFACFRGSASRIKTSVERVAVAASELREAGVALNRVSGGNSSLLWLLARGESLPGEITELRCGEALLLGQDALFYEPLPGCRGDACLLRAEVLEEYTKPARPGDGYLAVGGQDPVSRRRSVLGIGRQDLGAGRVRFVLSGLREVGRSADYLVVEVEGRSLRPGSWVEMIPSYEALVAAWTSPYVEVRLEGR